MKNCQHDSIVIVTEQPKGVNENGEEMFQTPKTWVECADCKEILNIRTVTQETKEVPLYPNYDT